MSFDTPASEPRLSPRLTAIVDSYSSSLAPEYWDWVGLSVCDAYGLDASAFTCSGEDILAAAKVAASKGTVEVPSISKSAGSSIPTVSPPFFNPKLSKSKPWEPQMDSVSSSAKLTEAKDKRVAAVNLLGLMDSASKERFLPGVTSDISNKDAERVLLTAIENLAGVGTLRGVFSAVTRIRGWHLRCFGKASSISAAKVALFMIDSLVSDGGDGHVSQALKDGLIFAANKLKLSIEIPDSVRAVAKPPKKSPKQAPSASVRAVYHFWQKAADASLPMSTRGASACFFVMSLSALRGIDAQRSSVDEKCLGEGTRLEYFTACAYDSKSRAMMPWACPRRAFHGDTSWVEPLFHIWGENDFMIPSCKHGVALKNVVNFEKRPASPYIILKYLREILGLPSVSMTESDAKLMRRHSFRHWIANCVRILKFPLSDAFQGGRWKEMAVMPLRYSQETKFVAIVDLISRVLAKCQEALDRVPAENWPVYGGWELLLDDCGGDLIQSFDIQEVVLPEQDEEGGESSGEDEPAQAEPVKRPVVRASAKKPRELPAGWSKHTTTLSSGTEVHHYYGPSGEYRRSLKQAWIAFRETESLASSPCENCMVGGSVEVWWPGDSTFYAAKVLEVSSSDSFSVKMEYVVDKTVLWHDMSVETWRHCDGGSASEVQTLAVSSEGGDTSQHVPRMVKDLGTAWRDGSPSIFTPAPDGSKRHRT